MSGLNFPRPPEWTERASCAQVGGDVWFPTKGGTDRGHAKLAKKICASCPVSAECLEYGIENGDGWGIWGGLQPKEMRSAKRAA